MLIAWRDKNLYGADKTNDKCTFYMMGSDQSNLIISANKSKYMHALLNNRACRGTIFMRFVLMGVVQCNIYL